jgi:hypothetical protein
MYQEYILGGKDGRCVRLKPYHLRVLIVLKSGNPNILEPSGPVQACNGITLPLYELMTQGGLTCCIPALKSLVPIFSSVCYCYI